MKIRRSLSTAALALTAVVAVGCSNSTGSSKAEEVGYPADGETVSLVVPFDAGGITDALARLLAPELGKSLGTTVNVVNKPGAGGQTGLTGAVAEDPDGYTITFTNLPSVLSYLDPARKASYTAESFTPIAGIALSPTIFAVPADSPFRTIEDVVTQTKAEAGSVTVGSGGSIASDDYLAAVGLEDAAGIDLNIVAYGGGAADKLTALLGGEIHVLVGSVSSVLSQYQSGDIRILAAATEKPSALLPDVPTLSAEGFEVNSPGTLNISGPAGLPADVVATLETALKEASSTPAFLAKLPAAGYEPNFLTSTELAEYWSATEKQVQPIITAAK